MPPDSDCLTGSAANSNNASTNPVACGQSARLVRRPSWLSTSLDERHCPPHEYRDGERGSKRRNNDRHPEGPGDDVEQCKAGQSRSERCSPEPRHVSMPDNGSDQRNPDQNQRSERRDRRSRGLEMQQGHGASDPASSALSSRSSRIEAASVSVGGWRFLMPGSPRRGTQEQCVQAGKDMMR